MTSSAFTICGGCHGALQPACYRCWLMLSPPLATAHGHSRTPRVTEGVVRVGRWGAAGGDAGSMSAGASSVPYPCPAARWSPRGRRGPAGAFASARVCDMAFRPVYGREARSSAPRGCARYPTLTRPGGRCCGCERGACSLYSLCTLRFVLDMLSAHMYFTWASTGLKLRGGYTIRTASRGSAVCRLILHTNTHRRTHR